ncbi:DUF362 domain-containing protein [Candidatus Woesearchaeota archaeon]|nr:DUF362 domain-containing protein [Candidatus Woesearchaeota archaeon]
MSIVVHKKIKNISKEEVISSVKKAMELAKWRNYVKGKRIFIKTNLLIKRVIPGLCTSPWVLEGIIRVLKSDRREVYIGDANVATIKQVEKAAKNWGVLDLCKKYNITFVNLSKQPTKRINFNGDVFTHVDVPNILTEVDSIITVPVLKTHVIPGMTCALKNQWGCIPTFRQQLHPVVDRAIPEINKVLKVSFAVVDATICLEGNGPVNGIPKIINSIFASNDLVSMDAFAADFIGLGKENVKYIVNADRLKVGGMKYKLTGDKTGRIKFIPPKIEDSFIVKTEMRLRNIPLLSYILFKTPLFKIPAFIASRYNTIYWYHNRGKKLRNEIIRNTLYREEFLQLIKNEK